MYKGQTNLSSIPEIEAEEDVDRKWVSKKKHEVLKAKYKCLKKLFQIYDASVIGILPEPSPDPVEEKSNRRRKRSHRTKTDACAGTNEITSGDNTVSEYENDNSSVATAIRDLTIDQSCISTQIDAKTDKLDKFAETTTATVSEKNFDICCQLEKNCHCQRLEHLNCQMQEKLCRDRLQAYAQIPYNTGYEKRKLTRFQCFVQRLFGIRRESQDRRIPGMMRRGPEGQLYAASDPILTCREKRRRRGLRFRRIRGRPKKVNSESALKDMRNPSILSYVQSVQKNCLMDTTPRKCPIPGCGMVSYGIINYNDHLNLCHFKDRKHICHYCHEGFETEHEKVVHENEHIGISKLGTNMSTLSSGVAYLSNDGGYLSPCGVGGNFSNGAYKIASDTQTEPEGKIPEEKLKKIVSFFDKINDPEQMLTDMKKNRFSETNLTSKAGTGSSSGSATERSHSSDTEKSQTISCCNLSRCRESKLPSSGESDASSKLTRLAPFNCRYCGESFTCKRQLSLHVNSEHRTRYTKYHSCAGIVRPRRCRDLLSEHGTINVHYTENSSNNSDTQSLTYGHESLKRVNTTSTLSQSVSHVSEAESVRKSDETLTCDPSTNIIYYSSVESLRKPSIVDSLVSKVRSYHWEPGTKIIRV